ncbi:hypothetical protein DH2020_006454 [Rehmannia glutinosa]|uniref:Glutamate receptor n=1 Tax=Rehmannia glutinosa TaxID=99300 RepID=A0ABR0XJ59_REHGL
MVGLSGGTLLKALINDGLIVPASHRLEEIDAAQPSARFTSRRSCQSYRSRMMKSMCCGGIFEAWMADGSVIGVAGTVAAIREPKPWGIPRKGYSILQTYIISKFPYFSLAIMFNCHAMGGTERKSSEQVLSVINIGLIQNLKSSFGTMINLCIEMAKSDFYAAHPNYKTRLGLRTKEVEDVLDVDLAVRELLDHEQVHGILGPAEELFIAVLGRKAHVPIISFTARSSALSNTENQYVVRTALDDEVQGRALAAICHGFEWKKVVVLYEDSKYGHQFLSHLKKAFQDVDIRLAHLIAIPVSANNSHLRKELKILKENQMIKVFLVHMSASLGSRLFVLAKKEGMMCKEHAWIMTDSLSNFLNTMDLATRDSMEGVVGIKPYVPFSKDLENFQERWKINSTILKINNTVPIMDLNVYGLWAYDTVTALAIAVEKIGPVNPSSLYEKTTTKTNLRISSFGPRLQRELSSTRFRGLSGDFQLVDGKLKPSAFEIFNVIGNGERRLGFWTPHRGIIREISSSGEAKYSTSIKELKKIVWPGDSVTRPKGWAIPPTGPLKVGVPGKSGYTEFVKVEIDHKTNQVHATGFAIDIFLAALKVLPFPINYTFICYNNTVNTSWTYDDMLGEIPAKNFDMVVGDATILASRAQYVDFSLPYSESGVVQLVNNTKAFNMSIFTKPLSWDLWLAILVSCILMGIVIWILERRVTNPDPDGRPGMIYLAPVTVLAFQDRNVVSNKWSFFLLVCWLFMAFILMQSFTANLSAILTVDQLIAFSVQDLYIGGYSSPEEFNDAMREGSKNGGIDCIIDEIPYVKLLLNRYDSRYKIFGKTYRTEGLGFAFPVGSPLAAYFSRAILNVTQGPEMTSIEQKNFGPGYSSQDPLSSTLSQGTSSLSFHDFAGLFIIVGSATVFAVICSETPFLSILSNITRQFFHEENANDASPGAATDEEQEPRQDRDYEEIVEVALINDDLRCCS